ncbi:hypothetical protein ACO0K0_05985 [Undibacterium sp. SXout11W]|uniref:hypothetical protein n=1 Tax=Undibacterium sp. SXout11W TaxID=3413050 RepID=UPI003BF3E83F
MTFTALDKAICASRKKADQKVSLSERSELRYFPVLRDAQIVPTRSDGTRRAKSQRHLLWLTFFGEARKVSGCRATPGLVLQRVIVLHIKNDA